MKIKRQVIGKMLAMVICILSTVTVFAQGSLPPDNEDSDPVGVPFDGGLSLVIAAGAGYAIKKARDKRKQTEVKDELEK
jgi:hypothetical protein